MKNYTKSSGHVFINLGFPNAEERLAKAELPIKIDYIIRKKRLTQPQVAKILGLRPPEISALLHGKLAEFSTNYLFKFFITLEAY